MNELRKRDSLRGLERGWRGKETDREYIILKYTASV
jgi:hypothetical protein